MFLADIVGGIASVIPNTITAISDAVRTGGKVTTIPPVTAQV